MIYTEDDLKRAVEAARQAGREDGADALIAHLMREERAAADFARSMGAKTTHTGTEIVFRARTVQLQKYHDIVSGAFAQKQEKLKP